MNRSTTTVIATARSASLGAATVLERLSGGISHDVFATDDGKVVKVYKSWQRGEPDREWAALARCENIGIAPMPVAYDAGEPPVVVMSRLPGAPLHPDALTLDHIAQIADGHHRVHELAAPDRAIVAAAADQLRRTRAMLNEWNALEPHLAAASDLVRKAGQLARAWLLTAEPDTAVRPDVVSFCRGDPNLSNYLWAEDRLFLIDWEDSGAGDPLFELADMAEHPSTRSLSESMWHALAVGTGIDETHRARLLAARRVVACFWLVVLERRLKRGLPVVQLTLDEQADRVAMLLE